MTRASLSAANIRRAVPTRAQVWEALEILIIAYPHCAPEICRAILGSNAGKPAPAKAWEPENVVPFKQSS